MNLDNYPTKCEKRNVNADTRITRTLNDDNFIPELGRSNWTQSTFNNDAKKI